MTPTFLYGQTPLPVNSTFIVDSNSMSPNLRQNDGVLVDSHFPFNSLKIGDIIVFRTFGTTDTGQHELIVHRVAQIVNDTNGQRIIRAKGDAIDSSIPSLDYPSFQQNYIGKVVYVIPQLGANANNSGGNTGTNWIDLCNKISFALISSCDTLVISDNTLTSQGMHVRDCIEGGALLAGAALLLGTPATTIVSVLPTVAQLGGCSDVLDLSKLTLDQLKRLGSILR